MTLYVLVDIGCIECHYKSAVVGVFDSEINANHAAVDTYDKWNKEVAYGPNRQLYILPVTGLNVIQPYDPTKL